MTARTRHSTPHRPAPIAVHDDCDVKSSVDQRTWQSTWHFKAHGEKNSRRRKLGQPLSLAARYRGRVANHLLEHLHVFEIASAPVGRNRAQRLRAFVLEALRHVNQSGFLEHLQMPA